MASWRDELTEAWASKIGPAVFATVDPAGEPNVVYVTWVKWHGAHLLIADNYFDKTRKNILSGSRGALVFLTKKGGAYQVKGALEYHTEGAVYEDMKEWLPDPQRHPGHAAVVLQIEEVYSNFYGAQRIH